GNRRYLWGDTRAIYLGLLALPGFGHQDRRSPRPTARSPAEEMQIPSLLPADRRTQRICRDVGFTYKCSGDTARSCRPRPCTGGGPGSGTVSIAPISPTGPLQPHPRQFACWGEEREGGRGAPTKTPVC
ncbi:hypothetical protein H1C71_029135, partial [Ictidomys tridecemlineatus]